MESPNRWFIAAVCVVFVAVAAGFAYFGYLESQSSGLCTTVVNPGCGIPDSVNLVAAWMNSPTSITLELSHTGQDNLSLSSYYIKDTAGNIYAAPTWTSPAIPANTNLNVTLTIDGKNFAFQQGNSYTVTVRTSQGYIETFTVTT
jgi:hypothetical protein